ncbi:MAG: hypothetical protein LRY37_01030, partial [Alkalibacterium thalassium]|nr:hypothetical protein [Alkalibacterium thalassium]
MGKHSSMAFFHLSISLGLLKVPYSFFGRDHPSDIIFRERSFEQKVKLWRNVFYVHKWKDSLPDGASLFKLGYKKKQLADTSLETMQMFILETKRAELTHLLLLLPAHCFSCGIRMGGFCRSGVLSISACPFNYYSSR